jgi:uncharacterized protein
MGFVLEQGIFSKVLQRSHKIYDAVHGFIRFNSLEKGIIDSEPFQRLHGIHQLGIAYLVYPGATHSRFEHSLGTMHLATQIFERISTKGFSLPDSEYWLQIIRFAALCHDLGHLPFSHDAEKEILGESGHEGWTYKVIRHMEPIWAKAEKYFPGRPIQSDVLKMAIGEKKLLEMGAALRFSSVEIVLSQIVTGDFFGADRIDYLLRDAQCTGVSHGFFDYQQLIEMLAVIPVSEGLELGIEENGIESCESLLLARHFMHQRVYQYVSVKVYKFHLARFMKLFFAEGSYLDSLESYLSLSDHEILAAVRRACKTSEDKGHEDACALMKREKRFRAILLEEGIEEAGLYSHLASLGIPSSAFFIEPCPSRKEKGDSSFFVQPRSLKIAPAKQQSKIVLHPKNERWIFVSPEFEKSVALHVQAGW